MIDLTDIDLAQFLTKWYGMPDRPTVRMMDHLDLPAPLIAWHELSSQWSEPLLAVKRFVPLNEISFHDDKAIFLTDPADAVWAIDSSENVYEGRLYGGWIKLTESLPEFLTHNALGEAAHNVPIQRSCSSVENARMADVLAPMTEVATHGWNWPGPDYRLFISENLVAEIGPALEQGAPLEEKTGFSEVQIGATESPALSYLDSIPGDWF